MGHFLYLTPLWMAIGFSLWGWWLVDVEDVPTKSTIDFAVVSKVLKGAFSARFTFRGGVGFFTPDAPGAVVCRQLPAWRQVAAAPPTRAA
jgi:hypothetical protein